MTTKAKKESSFYSDNDVINIILEDEVVAEEMTEEEFEDEKAQHQKNHDEDTKEQKFKAYENVSFEEMEKLEDEFTEVIKGLENDTNEASILIKVDDLGEVQSDIIKAKEYIEDFAKGETSIPETALSIIGRVPFIGSFIDSKIEEVKLKRIKESNIETVVNDMFDNISKKKDKMEDIGFAIYDMKVNLENHVKTLREYVQRVEVVISTTNDYKVKRKALDMVNLAQVHIQITNEMINNQITWVLSSMEDLSSNIIRTIPMLKQTLKTSLSISGTINDVNKTVQMMNSIQSLSNNIIKTSTANVQTLMIETSKAITDGNDIKYLEESAERTKKFQKQFVDLRIEGTKKAVETYKKLNILQNDASNMLENKVKAEKLALEDLILNVTPNNEKYGG